MEHNTQMFNSYNTCLFSCDALLSVAVADTEPWCPSCWFGVAVPTPCFWVNIGMAVRRSGGQQKVQYYIIKTF